MFTLPNAKFAQSFSYQIWGCLKFYMLFWGGPYDWTPPFETCQFMAIEADIFCTPPCGVLKSGTVS